MIWYDLREIKPVGNRCVILFPCISDVGILYTASNPEYARKNALKNGYTHFAYIDPAPEEEEIKEKIKQVYRNE